MDFFLRACRERGIKVTHQRIAIYRDLASTGAHPDAQMIFKRLRKKMPTLSLDTVYRNLRLLEACGIVHIVGTSHDRLRFDANLEPHHHFTCTECSQICDFELDGSRQLIWPEEAKVFGKPVSLHLDVRGICRKCQTK
ncbi:MAG: transcriptional repressor [Candidatus Hydrogenedentes bacterium]|nr:transcriptional repressor [Candidatus Hydrogenedentota bacterium]